MTKINAPTLFTLAALTLAACNPLPVTTPDEAPATVSDCPCPDFAHPWHPGVGREDPDHPGECMARSRTNQWMDARNHPQCRQEALERMGW